MNFKEVPFNFHTAHTIRVKPSNPVIPSRTSSQISCEEVRLGKALSVLQLSLDISLRVALLDTLTFVCLFLTTRDGNLELQL